MSCILPFSRLKTRYELWHESLRVRGEFYTSIASGSRDREEYSQAECQFHGPQSTADDAGAYPAQNQLKPEAGAERRRAIEDRVLVISTDL